MKKKGNLQRKLEAYAIPNLSLYLIICYGIGYILQYMSASQGVPLTYYLQLDPFQILQGQVWRLVTWVLIPPEESNVLFVLIMLYLYYSLGNLLERIWGTYKFNVYIFSGIGFTILGSFVAALLAKMIGVQPYYLGNLLVYMLDNGSMLYFGQFSTYYINMSIFLACAATIPDVQVMLMFLFPIKVKWLGIIYGVILLVNCIQGGLVTWIVIGFSLMNFLVFFINSRGKMKLTAGQVRSRQQFKSRMRAAEMESRTMVRHKCAICGRTEEDGEHLEFRYCSKCEGNYEYCQDHLFTHEHVKRS